MNPLAPASASAPAAAPPTGLRRVFAWPRLKVAGGVALVWSIPFTLTWETHHWILYARFALMVLFTLTAFGVFEVWPRRLPTWFARWALQVIAVAVAIPVAVLIGYTVTTIGLDPPWWKDGKRMSGAFTFIAFGMLTAPWVAVAALLNQIKEEARKQALEFELTRSQLEKNALDARFRLLQAQVQPHFLFNTLANVRELVVTGSPHAAPVLENLISYLRAAVPRLDEAARTVADETDMVKNYLELMRLRMPDRLTYSINVEPAALSLPCPPATLLTLVENAVRHGIDPAEEGGHVAVQVRVQDNTVLAEVSDTGAGLDQASGSMRSAQGGGLGTGLTNLRERLTLAFGSTASVSLTAMVPRGVRAEAKWPLAAAREFHAQ